MVLRAYLYLLSSLLAGSWVFGSSSDSLGPSSSLDATLWRPLEDRNRLARERSTPSEDVPDDLDDDEDELGEDSLTRPFQRHMYRLSPKLDLPPPVDDDLPAAARPPHKFLSTGTTIAGVIGDGFLVLGADTRATAGRLVADKAADKIHRIAANIFACGAGTSADLGHVTRLAYYSLRLAAEEEASIGNEAIEQSANYEYPVSVEQACRFLQVHLYEQGGQCQANLILGGVYQGRAYLRAIHPHGSMDDLEFAALGSGGLAAMAVLESRYRSSMSKEDAIQLVKDAIVAGIENDLGSGSQVDLCVIDRDGSVEHTRAAVAEEQLDVRPPVPADAFRPSIPGVNGFGNVAYSIVKRRTMSESKAEREKEWNDLLGL